MKPRILIQAFTICAAIGLLSACGRKNTQATNQPVENPQPAAQQPAQPPPATPVANPSSQAASDAEMIRRCLSFSTTLVNQKKYSEALATLNQLNSMTLTAEQQSQLNSLKAKIPGN
jgi:hypothetical protein